MQLQYILFIIILLGSQLTGFSQEVITKKTATGKAKSLYDRGVKYSSNSIYTKALADFEKVIKLAPNFIDAHIQLAMVQYDLKAYAKAETSFEKALALDGEYKSRVYYMLATTEAYQEKYDEAIANYEAFIERAKPTSDTEQNLKKRAEKHIKNYSFLKEAKKNPVPFDPQSVGSNINTIDQEYLPSLTADGQTMIYTKRIRGQEDFYQSEFRDDKWQLGTPILEINNPQSNEGAQSISADGRFLVFTKCGEMDGFGACDLYFSEVRNGRWTPPANIGAPINTRAWEAQPSLSADGRTLYFASTRKGGMGESDIWMSRRNKAGKWSTPVNLGAPINTAQKDETPFMHPDGATLYFMSNGHPGMGSFDLYYSRKTENDSWKEPTNLGYPINTDSHEGAMIVSLDGKTAYFASNRDFTKQEDEQSTTGTDIYSFELYEAARPKAVTYVKALVKDGNTGKPLQANVEMVNLTKSEIYSSSVTDTDGEFLVCLPLGKNYGLNVSKEGYLFHSENFALDALQSLDKPYLLEIELFPIPTETASTTSPTTSTPLKSNPIILKNIFFETGSAELLSSSFSELNKLYGLLNENASLRIQINGHTDNVGSDTDNFQLSDARAKSVYTWLIEKGITATRLSYKGYGESQPISTNDTDEGRQANRRTEFVVL